MKPVRTDVPWVEPDHFIDTYEHFFDRNALTEYIHGLY